MTTDLAALRARLTMWYVGAFALVMFAFGLAMFYVATREISNQLDRSLVNAVDAVIASAKIREREGPAKGAHVDALDELHIPDRSLYLFDDSGRLIHPDTASPWIHEVAAEAAKKGSARGSHHFRDIDATWRASGRRFTLRGAVTEIAVASADRVELEDSYPGVIVGFGVAALIALLLAGAGGWGLARRSLLPVEHAFAGMRRFVADAAHELRTPVSVLKGQAEVALRRERAPQEYVAALQSIHSEAGRLAGVLENLLMISRADAGAFPITRDAVYLDDIVLDAADAARVLGALKDVTVTVDHLDEISLNADRSLLRQLVMILLDNAVKFTPAGGRVMISVSRMAEAGTLTVSDTGPGIAPDQVPYVFERFSRGPDVDRATGAGLGLAIAKWIAEAHGASISVHRAAAGGAELRVSFPLTVA